MPFKNKDKQRGYSKDYQKMIREKAKGFDELLEVYDSKRFVLAEEFFTKAEEIINKFREGYYRKKNLQRIDE